MRETPTKPKKPCAHPGCPALVPANSKFCEKHKLLHPEEVRSAAKRGYGSKWQKASKEYLRVHPLCVKCLEYGKFVKATDVDHIIPHRGDQTLFWDRSNWQALCHRHHSIKTGTQDMHPVYKY